MSEKEEKIEKPKYLHDPIKAIEKEIQRIQMQIKIIGGAE